MHLTATSPTRHQAGARNGSVLGSAFGSDENVTLNHGSALIYCNSIASATGVNYEQLTSSCNGAYAFCTSTSVDIAKGYALLNPLVRMQGQPAGVVSFKLTRRRLQEWVESGLVRWVLPDQAYEFINPETFPVINIERTDVSVQIITETTFRFDQ